MTKKHSQEFRDYEARVIKAALHKPMNRYDLERIIKIKSLYVKLNAMANKGEIFRALKTVGNKTQVFYSLTPIDNDPSPIVIPKQVQTTAKKTIDDYIVRNGASTTYSLTDFARTRGSQARQRVYVNGNSLSNF